MMVVELGCIRPLGSGSSGPSIGGFIVSILGRGTPAGAQSSASVLSYLA